jgi:hypothetical protein
LEKENFDSLERKILTVWKRKILTVWKGKFWQLSRHRKSSWRHTKWGTLELLGNHWKAPLKSSSERLTIKKSPWQSLKNHPPHPYKSILNHRMVSTLTRHSIKHNGKNH